MPANAKTFLLRNGHSRKEEFERVVNPPSGIAFGVPLRGAKTRWVFIPLRVFILLWVEDQRGAGRIPDWGEMNKREIKDEK
jgi:hypothetical protein